MMEEQQPQRGLRSSEIRVPHTLEELRQALAVVRDRVESITQDLAQRDQSRFKTAAAYEEWRERAERAHATWSSKLRELEYWGTRFAADADPERTRLRKLVAELEMDYRTLHEAARRAGVRL